jgi:cyclic pyranopterin phosphate synthase
MDDLRIDSHKLIFHLDRVAEWKRKGIVAPLYVEVSPSGSCNHRCIFCAVDYLKYQPVFLDAKILTKRVREMAKLGVRSIMYAGEGEPLIHKDIAGIVTTTKQSGIDVAITTNGVLLTKSLSEQVLP